MLDVGVFGIVGSLSSGGGFGCGLSSVVVESQVYGCVFVRRGVYGVGEGGQEWEGL